MNLYRNFGSMLETWVVASDPELDGEDVVEVEGKGQALRAEAERPKGPVIRSLAGVILRSESEDSGVETENAPSTPGSLCSGFSPVHRMEVCDGGGGAKDRLSLPLLPSRSLSTSSLDAASLEKTDPPVEMGLTVEQALRRASQSQQRYPRRASSVEPFTSLPLRADPRRRTAAPSRCHSMVFVSGPGQRSEGLGLGTAFRPPTASQKVPELAELCSFLRDPQPGSLPPTLSDNEHSGEAPGLHPSLGKGLSPGLGYLEQVCRLLEEIARLQLRNQELQRENESAQNPQRAQACQCLDGCPEIPVKFSQSPDTEGYEDLSQDLVPSRLRQRSMSDTWELSLCRGEMQSILREEVMLNVFDGREPSAKQQDRSNGFRKAKIDSVKWGIPRLEPLRPPGKNGPKKIGMLFKKKDEERVQQIFRGIVFINL